MRFGATLTQKRGPTEHATRTRTRTRTRTAGNFSRRRCLNERRGGGGGGRRRLCVHATTNLDGDFGNDGKFAPKGSPEDILRVSRQTSFEGLKAARRVALEEKTHAPEIIDKAFEDIVDNSVRFFKTKAEENETDADAQFALGNVYQTLEMPEKAIEQYEKTLKCSNKTHLDASNNIAMLLQEKGDIDKAEAYYLNALTHHPESVDVMFNWASLKVQCRQDLDGARILINRIVTIEPKLKKHPLVKELAGEEIDDEPDEPFVPPI